ncbi:hypothetical protein Tco_0294060 [Tanacetum coccineum]
MRHGLYETIVCYVLLANMIWIVMLERDRLKALLWIVNSERDRLIVVDRDIILAMFSPTRKKSRWGTVFPTGLKRYKEPLVEPKEIGIDFEVSLSKVRNRADPAVLLVVQEEVWIVCHEKVVEIPLEGSRKLRVQGGNDTLEPKSLNERSNIWKEKETRVLYFMDELGSIGRSEMLSLHASRHLSDLFKGESSNVKDFVSCYNSLNDTDEN